MLITQDFLGFWEVHGGRSHKIGSNIGGTIYGLNDLGCDPYILSFVFAFIQASILEKENVVVKKTWPKIHSRSGV